MSTILIAGTITLLAFAHASLGALRLVASANGLEQLQAEAALDSAALITRTELESLTEPPFPTVLSSITIADVDITRVVEWVVNEGQTQVTIMFTSSRGPVIEVTYELSAEKARFSSYQ